MKMVVLNLDIYEMCGNKIAIPFLSIKIYSCGNNNPKKILNNTSFFGSSANKIIMIFGRSHLTFKIALS